MKYSYIVGGITLSTDIFYPELISSSNNPEVFLAYGNVPDFLTENTVSFPFIEANEKQFLLKLENVGRFLVENGTNITIELDANGNKSDLEKFVLTSVFGALSYQRNIIPIHGGVFVKNDEGILVTGISGQGKSTLIATLLKEGYQILSDDISNIKLIDNKVYVFPFCPYLLLWKETLQKLNFDIEKAHKFRLDLEKYFFPIPENQFKNEKIELKKIIVITENEKESLKEINEVDKFEIIQNNIYLPWMINTLKKQEHFLNELKLINNNVSIDYFFNNRNKDFEHNVASFHSKIESYAK